MLPLFGEANIVTGEHVPAHLLNGDYSRKRLKTLFDALAPNSASFQLSHTKAYIESMLIRDFVNLVVALHSKHVFDTFIGELAKETHSHERFFATLLYTDEFQLPGGFSRICTEFYGDKVLQPMFRGENKLVVSSNGIRPNACCSSGTYRNEICLRGLQDFDLFLDMSFPISNKFGPKFNYPTYNCAMEALEHKSQHPDGTSLDGKGSSFVISSPEAYR